MKSKLMPLNHSNINFQIVIMSRESNISIQLQLEQTIWGKTLKSSVCFYNVLQGNYFIKVLNMRVNLCCVSID